MVDTTPRVVVGRRPDGRFGLVCLTGNPDDPSDDGKRLTFSPDGKTNNTRVMVDGRSPILGDDEGETVEPWHAGPGDSMVIAWSFRDVLVRQSLRLVPGDVSGRLDTIRVTYELKNQGTTARSVGLRVMLDTLIGDNDGVPFIVPGRDGIVTQPLAMRGADVPDFVRSLEQPGPVESRRDRRPQPGARRGGGPSRRAPALALAGRECGMELQPAHPFGNDTAAGLYYPPAPLEPGRTRAIGFSYGLGTISSTATRNARLSLTAGGPIRAGSSFWLVALVDNPRPGQTVKLTLPDGLTPRRPASTSQPVEGSGAYTQLSWLIEVAPGLMGDVRVEATLDPGGITERQALKVQPPDAQLSLMPRGPFRAGRPFWISALVRNPREGQSVALTLPDGLTLADGHKPTMPVAAGAAGGYAQVNWLVVPGPRVEGRRGHRPTIPRQCGWPRGHRDRAGRSDSLTVLAARTAVPLRGIEVDMSLNRLIYYSAIIGGWSAFLGWMISEYLLNRGDGSGGRLAVAMTCAMVGGAIGAGLNLVAGMANAQWKQQIKRVLPGFIAGGLGGAIGGFMGDILFSLVPPAARPGLDDHGRRHRRGRGPV